MSMHHGQHQPTGVAPDLSLGGLLIGFPLLISCVFILFSSLWTALFLAGYAVIAFGLGAVAADTNRLAKIGATLLFLSVLAAALVLGFGVFTFHWLSLTLAGWAVTGLYFAGLVIGVFAALSAGLRLLALLAGAALAAALVFLPVPTSALPPSEEDRRDWFVELTVLDADNQPVEGANAACAVAMRWNGNARPDLETEDDFATDISIYTTGEDGVIGFRFTEDPRLKLATCAAWVSYARMDAEYARQAYYGDEVPRHDPAYGVVFAPLYGETAHLTIRLREHVPVEAPEPWPTQ